MNSLPVPVASYRLAVAIRYWHAARIVLENQIRDAEYMEPVGHLLSMSAELSLKAFLANTGMSDRELKQQKIGHDLGALLRLCVDRGLELSESDATLILIMRTAHLEHFHRYGPEGEAFGAFAINLAKDDLALAAIARLLDLIGGEPNLLRKQHQRTNLLDWPETLPPLYPVAPARLEQLAKGAEDHAMKIESIGKPHKPKAQRRTPQ